MRVSLPITTVALPSRAASTRPAARPRRSMKSAETGPSPTRPRMPSVPKYLRFDISVRSGFGNQRRGLAHHHREQRGQAIAHLAAIDDQVDGAVLDQEFGTLETFRQRFAHGPLDHARAGEAD